MFRSCGRAAFQTKHYLHSTHHPAPLSLVPKTTSPVTSTNTIVRWSTSSSGGNGYISEILSLVQTGKLSPHKAEELIHSTVAASSFTRTATTDSNTDNTANGNPPPKEPDELLQYFASLDHKRTARTGFPEVVFAEGKTSQQVAMILEDMALHVNQSLQQKQRQDEDSDLLKLQGSTAILASRVTPGMYEELANYNFEQGTISYHKYARIVSMHAASLPKQPQSPQQSIMDRRVVVATAGTTDLPVAEEAAVILEAAGCSVDRIFDVGVAGLHRVVGALPRLRQERVGAVIVCAGMDGALPSVVGGLVSVPVFAVPTSVGYGVSLGGIAAMLTMLNSCAPGVSVVNIDNGLGAAACAFKAIKNS